MSYNIETHIHLFSSWAASRASSTSKVCRFKVEIGQKILDNSQIKNFILNPNLLPANQETFNKQHKIWREEIIKLAKNEGKTFTHGISAKLINIYLKSVIICGGYHDNPNAQLIHPPIDRVLLKELALKNFNNNKKFWNEYKQIGWSNFTSQQYETIIEEIKNGLNEKPLWKIEEYWKGYQ